MTLARAVGGANVNDVISDGPLEGIVGNAILSGVPVVLAST